MSTATPFPRTREGSETGLRELFAHAPFAMARFSRHGVITEMNPAMEQILGSGRTNFPSLRDLLDLSDHAEAGQRLRELMAGERSSFQVEQPLFAGSDSTAWVKWTAWNVPSANGEPDCNLLVAQDTTANRRAEWRLQQAQKLETVGRMTGSIAHDFNNLITGILLHCDLLLAEMLSDTRQRKYAEEIRAAGLQATTLVKQLLTPARPQDSPVRPLPLNEVIQGMWNLLVGLVGANKALHLHLDPDLGQVKIKSAHVQQILLNLVLNARDATPDGGQISVQTRKCQLQIVTSPRPSESGSHDAMPAALPCAVVVVTDHGSGMDAETKEHMFDPFFTTKTSGGGTGLGLTSVHDIVTSNGGLIYLDSAPGRGTRVTVLLPLFAGGDESRKEALPHIHEGEKLKQEKEPTP